MCRHFQISHTIRKMNAIKDYDFPKDITISEKYTPRGRLDSKMCYISENQMLRRKSCLMNRA